MFTSAFSAQALPWRYMIKRVSHFYHLTLVRMAIIKSLQITNVGEGVEKREPSYTVGGNVN